MSKFNYKWMNLAYIEALEAQKRLEVPIGAVIVNLKNNQLISKSGNNVVNKSNPLAHAEIEAINLALNLSKSPYLQDTAIYITLEPCLMCASAITEVRIPKVYFGAYDEKAGSMLNNDHKFKKNYYYKTEIYGGILENKCSKLLKNFFKDKRKKNN